MQSQARWVSEQPGVGEGAPAPGSGIETWSLMSLSPQTIPWFYDKSPVQKNLPWKYFHHIIIF